MSSRGLAFAERAFSSLRLPRGRFAAGATYAVEGDLPIEHPAVSGEYDKIVTNARACLTAR